MEYWCEKTGKDIGRTSICGKTEIEEHINLNSADVFKSTYSLITWHYMSGSDTDLFTSICGVLFVHVGWILKMHGCLWVVILFSSVESNNQREYLFSLESIFVCTFCQFLWIMKRAENVPAKCEIAHYEQLLRLQQCFKKSFAEYAPICACRWEKVKANRCSGQNA